MRATAFAQRYPLRSLETTLVSLKNMAQEESPNLFFNELLKSKQTPETRAAWLANHLKLVELGEKKEEKKVREEAVTFFVRDDGSVRFPPGKFSFRIRTRKGYQMLGDKSIHRLVAEAFVKNPRPDIFDIVDHINCDKSNNHYTNLRWVDCELNAANRKDSRNVYLHKHKQKWAGNYAVGGKKKSKCFDNEADAYEWAHREKAVAWEKLYQEKISQTRS